jgi:hypothetical protein
MIRISRKAAWKGDEDVKWVSFDDGDKASGTVNIDFLVSTLFSLAFYRRPTTRLRSANVTELSKLISCTCRLRSR